MSMIPFSSDTATRPTAGMRRAMFDAEVGDEQRGTDPTVNLLLEKVADLLGKEKALFFPGGTMCNLVSVKVHTQPGDAMITERMAHIVRAESAGPAFSSGVYIETIDTARGVFTPEELQQSIDLIQTAVSPYSPRPKLVVLEQTHNFRGGTYWKSNEMRAVHEVAAAHGMKVHMDGARLLNAAVASGENPRSYGKYCDSLWVDFTKGLGAPIGAVLAGSEEFIREARRLKHVFGGALRQAGVVAAGCLYALDHHIDRLVEDHAHARLLAEKLALMDGIEVVNPEPETNMVFFKPTYGSAAGWQQALKEQGIDIGRVGAALRAVTHLDIKEQDVHALANAVSEILEQGAVARDH